MQEVLTSPGSATNDHLRGFARQVSGAEGSGWVAGDNGEGVPVLDAVERMPFLVALVQFDHLQSVEEFVHLFPGEVGTHIRGPGVIRTEEIDRQDPFRQQGVLDPLPHRGEACARDEWQRGIGQDQIGVGEGIPLLDEARPVFEDAERGEFIHVLFDARVDVDGVDAQTLLEKAPGLNAGAASQLDSAQTCEVLVGGPQCCECAVGERAHGRGACPRGVVGGPIAGTCGSGWHGLSISIWARRGKRLRVAMVRRGFPMARVVARVGPAANDRLRRPRGVLADCRDAVKIARGLRRAVPGKPRRDRRRTGRQTTQLRPALIHPCRRTPASIEGQEEPVSTLQVLIGV